MPRRVVIGSILATALAVPASASGVYLKLAAPTREAAVGQPVQVTLSAVATRSVVLPAQPEVIADDAQGRPRKDVQWKPAEAGSLAVSPEGAAKTSYELAFPEPGTYRVKLRYRLSDRVVETNKLTFTISAPGGHATAR